MQASCLLVAWEEASRKGSEEGYVQGAEGAAAVAPVAGGDALAGGESGAAARLDDIVEFLSVLLQLSLLALLVQKYKY